MGESRVSETGQFWESWSLQLATEIKTILKLNVWMQFFKTFRNCLLHFPNTCSCCSCFVTCGLRIHVLSDRFIFSFLMLGSNILRSFGTPKTSLRISNPHAVESKINSTIYGLVLLSSELSSISQWNYLKLENIVLTLVQYMKNIVFFFMFSGNSNLFLFWFDFQHECSTIISHYDLREW